MNFRPLLLIGPLAGSVALVSVASAPLAAQVDIDSLRAARTCDNALRIVARGHPEKMLGKEQPLVGCLAWRTSATLGG